MSYEIPVSAGYDGVNMQSLARRIARAVVHFVSVRTAPSASSLMLTVRVFIVLQANGISIVWDRVVLHRLDETSSGMWTPVLTMI